MGAVHPEIVQWQAAVQWETCQLLRTLVTVMAPGAVLPDPTPELDAASVFGDLYRVAVMQDEASDEEAVRLRDLLRNTRPRAGRPVGGMTRR